MIKPEDEIIIDLSTSCTKEIAVINLLGWVKGPIIPKALANPQDRISEDLLSYVRGPYGSLTAFLYELRDTARHEYFTAAETGAPIEETKEKEDAVKHAESTINKAFMYLSDIDEELSKGKDSAIKIDIEGSENSSATYITLKSVDQWAKKKYGISILDNQEQHLSPEDTQTHAVKQVMKEDVDPEGILSPMVSRNVLVTFGYLIEAFAETATGFGKGKKPNQKAISIHIKELAAKDSGKGAMENQSFESIRKRIKQAIDIKNTYLKNR